MHETAIKIVRIAVTQVINVTNSCGILVAMAWRIMPNYDERLLINILI